MIRYIIITILSASITLYGASAEPFITINVADIVIMILLWVGVSLFALMTLIKSAINIIKKENLFRNIILILWSFIILFVIYDESYNYISDIIKFKDYRKASTEKSNMDISKIKEWAAIVKKPIDPLQP